MSISSKKILVGVLATVFTAASAGAFAQDYRNDRPDYRDQGRDDRPYDSQYDDRNDQRDDDRYGDAYEYAKVLDVQPLISRVRVSTPEQECWNETRYDQGGYNRPDSRTAGGTLLGAVIGAAIGNQIGHGDGRRAATAAGAIIGAGVGNSQAQRRGGYSTPPREYSVQRCATRYHDEWQERTDGYRVTYLYHGRRQVTQLPYDPGNRVRVRVDVSVAQ